MSTYKNLMTVCCAAVLTLGLAACGGGGGGDGTVDTPPPVVEPDPTPAQQLAAAEKAVMDAEAAVAAATTAAERSAAYGQLAMAQQMLTAAQALPENVAAAERAAYEQQIRDLQMRVDALTQQRTVEDAIAMAKAAADALTVDSTDMEVADAKALRDAANTALTESTALSMEMSDGFTSQIGAVSTTISGIEDDQATAAMTAELNEVMGAVTEAVDAVAALTGTSSDDDVAAAKQKITDAQAALDGATLISADDRMAQQGRIDDIDVAAAETMISEARAAKVVADTKAALTKETAISTEAAQTTDAGLGGSAVTATGNSEGAYNLEIARDNDGTTITVRVEGATDDDDETFMKAADLMSSTNPGQMLTRTMDADADGNVVTEVAIVYTDIEAPKATAFGMVHTLDVRVDGETATEADPNDALNVATANLAHVKAGAFTAPAGTVGTTTLSFQQAVADDESTTDVDESRDAAEIAGTYEGAPGTYKCNATGTACTVTVNTMGVVSAQSGSDTDWIFIPDAGAMVDVADTNYLHYGAWLQRTADSDGAVTYNEVETFAGVTGLAASGDISGVSGIAEYEGGAAGVYVHKTFAQDGTSEATSGHFSADASLTAYFSGGATPANKADTLEGTIDNFVLSGGEANSWSVELQSDGDPNTDGVQPDTDGVMAGTASGGVAGQDGSFTATFHGDVTATGTPPVAPAPTAVVGEFNAVFSNGSVAGGFGARKE